MGSVEIDVPRDRNGEFEPQILKKNQISISQDVEEKILSMYAKGMSVADIKTHICEIHDLEVSDSTVSRITVSQENGSSALWKAFMQSYFWMPFISMCAVKDRL